MIPDLHTEEVAEVRNLSGDTPELPPLSQAALRSRLRRAGALLSEDPREAIKILTAPAASSGVGEA